MAKEAQALLIAITHHLLVLYEQELERRHGVTNEAEDRRRAKRSEKAGKECEKAGSPLSSLVLCARRATRRSVKFVRWLCASPCATALRKPPPCSASRHSMPLCSHADRTPFAGGAFLLGHAEDCQMLAGQLWTSATKPLPGR